MILKLILIVTIFVRLNGATTPVTTFEIKLDNLLKMQQGIGWPPKLTVAEGNEALLRLSRNLPNQRSCSVITPRGLTFDVNSPPNSRYKSWSEMCGVRVRNINKLDEGRWRLVASSANHSITGWTEVYVQEKVPSYSGSPISIQDGQTKTEIDLTSLENSYCIVAKPFSESSLVPGHCSVTLDRATRAVQGYWNVLLGIPGQVSEVPVRREVAIETERLNVGYDHDTTTNKLHLYCNILHSSKNITFCRFQKTTNSYGYNIVDGLSDGSHSYYGEGFVKKQCGMTIENPTVQDYSTWRCSVGVQMWVGNQIEKQTPLQALISVGRNSRRVGQGGMQRNENANTKIFVQENQSFTIMCRAEVSLQYCWFQHPNGSQFTPVQLASQEQLFWYTGESLQTGNCGITFKHVTRVDAGEWICHMGPRDQLGVEVTDRVQVRVTGPLAAVETALTMTVGSETTLYCRTANGRRPLEYCRFLSPKAVGISIDSSVTKDNPILNRFYFTTNRSLDRGDCSLDIMEVTTEDLGEWTCAALLTDEVMESRDTIIVTVIEVHRFRAGIIGMSVGLVVLAVVLVAFLLYRRGWLMPTRNTVDVAPASQVTFRNSPESRKTASISSESSNEFDTSSRRQVI